MSIVVVTPDTSSLTLSNFIGHSVVSKPVWLMGAHSMMKFQGYSPVSADSEENIIPMKSRVVIPLGPLGTG